MFDFEQDTYMMGQIQHFYAERRPVSYEDLRALMSLRFGQDVVLGSLRAWVSRHELVKTARWIPMEDARPFSSPAAIDEFFQEIRHIIGTGNIPAAFIMNIDEAGFCRFVDQRTIICVVPASYGRKLDRPGV